MFRLLSRLLLLPPLIPRLLFMASLGRRPPPPPCPDVPSPVQLIVKVLVSIMLKRASPRQKPPSDMESADYAAPESGGRESRGGERICFSCLHRETPPQLSLNQPPRLYDPKNDLYSSSNFIPVIKKHHLRTSSGPIILLGHVWLLQDLM